MSITFRLATEADLVALAVMHIQAWREAYRGLMPDVVLDALDPAKREITWLDTLRQGKPVTLVCSGDSIVRFMGCGARRNPALLAEGEIYGLCVLELAQRKGIGRRLFLEGLALLANKAFNSAALWVLEGNARARRFYEAQGRKVVAHRVESHDGWELGEGAYIWESLPQRHTNDFAKATWDNCVHPTVENS